jgi:hypothetical protein
VEAGQSRGRGKGDAEAVLAGGQAQARRDVGVPRTAVVERDDVLARSMYSHGAFSRTNILFRLGIDVNSKESRP